MDTGRTWHVRSATRGDAAHQARLRWDWRCAEGERPPGTLGAFTEEFARWLAAHADTHAGFVGTVGEEVVGIAFLAIIERVPGPEVWDRRSGYVQSVYVDSAHRGAGLGRALVEAVVDDAQARGLQYVSVHPGERSRPLYERVGFAQNGRTLQLRF